MTGSEPIDREASFAAPRHAHRLPPSNPGDFGRSIVAVVVAPLVFLIVYSAFAPDQDLFQTDSDSYLQFAAMRTGGYPFFLAVLRPLASNPHIYVHAQLVAFAAAAAGLGWSIFRSSNSVLTALLAQTILLANPEVNKQHFTLMTESLFLSVSVVMIAAALRYLSRPSCAALIVAALAAGYAAAIRPTGLVYLPVLAVLVFSRRGWTERVWRNAAAAAVAVAAVFLAEAFYYHANHDGPRQSLLPVQTFGKAGMVTVGDPSALLAGAPRETRSIYHALEADLQPMREFIAGAPNAAARCRLTANYESFVEYEFLDRDRRTLQSSFGDWPLTMAGLDRIAHAKRDFARHVADNYYCLWTIWAATNAEKDALQDYIARHRPIPFEANVLASLATRPSPPAVIVVRPILISIASLLALAAATVLVAAAIGAPPSLWFSTAGVCGLMVHGTFLLTAATGIATPRYTLAAWAPMAIGVLAFVIWAAQRSVARGRGAGRGDP